MYTICIINHNTCYIKVYNHKLTARGHLKNIVSNTKK